MITQIRGVLRSVGEEELTLAVEPMELSVLIPEHTRRQLQKRVGELVSLHTIFFIASTGLTQGPPDSLHPGEPAMASSSPSWSANCVVYRNASFHSGVMYTSRLSTSFGVPSAASKF